MEFADRDSPVATGDDTPGWRDDVRANALRSI
jgi:hypothetical protein